MLYNDVWTYQLNIKNQFITGHSLNHEPYMWLSVVKKLKNVWLDGNVCSFRKLDHSVQLEIETPIFFSPKY